MKNNEYKKVDGYEIHPADIALAISKMQPGTIKGLEEDLKELEEAIYQLDAICQNEYNKDFYRVLYNYLAHYADKYLTEIMLPFKA